MAASAYQVGRKHIFTYVFINKLHWQKQWGYSIFVQILYSYFICTGRCPTVSYYRLFS